MTSRPETGRANKLASKVARDIEAEIVRRGWPIGESLGSEQALRQRYGVSRSVLREAVRLVEHHRVARMRRGPNGGLLVCEPDAGPATRAVVIYLEYLGTSLGDLLNARMVLERLAPDQRLRIQQLPIRPRNPLHHKIITRHTTHSRQTRPAMDDLFSGFLAPR